MENAILKDKRNAKNLVIFDRHIVRKFVVLTDSLVKSRI